MNATAVSNDIRGQPGTMYVSCSMSSVHPATTNSPTVSDTNAANRARKWLESARSEGTM